MWRRMLIIGIWSTVTIWTQTDVFPRAPKEMEVTTLRQMIEISTQNILLAPFFLTIDEVEDDLGE
ncbi:MAG: hypothetical protein IJ824_01035 [Alphaproteobacteria bacterium]|nr:hypothetical protein [Alphaproteobacteria bacterium]